MGSKALDLLTGRGHPLPMALYRIVFYGGIALHFVPSLLYLQENYSVDAYRTQEWNETLYRILPTLPPAVVGVLALVTCAGILAGLLGVYPRVAAAVAGVGCYVFASFNGLQVQTLAITSAWAVFFILAFFGGGNEALSLHGKFGIPPAKPAPRTARTLILAQMMIGLFFAGIEKIAAGWLTRNEMEIVFGYPHGFMIRAWADGNAVLMTPTVGWMMTYGTLVVELLVPILIWFKPTRTAAVVVFEGFFLAIIATMEVPPLFYCLYAGAGILALDDDFWRAVAARVQRTSRGKAGAGAVKTSGY